MSPRITGIFLVCLSVLSGVFAQFHLHVPVFKLPDLAGDLLHQLVTAVTRSFRPDPSDFSEPTGTTWLVRIILAISGIFLIVRRQRLTGFVTLTVAVLSGAVAHLDVSIPVLNLPSFLGRTLYQGFKETASGVNWLVDQPDAPKFFSWAFRLLLIGAGILLILRGSRWNLNPLTVRKLQRFRHIHRGYRSALVLGALVLLACLDSLIVGHRALIVRYDGGFSFPFIQETIKGTDFGESSETEADYRALKKRFQTENKGNWLLLPLVPYGPRLDSSELVANLESRDNLFYAPGESEPFNGRAHALHEDKPAAKRAEWVFRHGKRQGEVLTWDTEGEQTGRGRYENDTLTNYTDYTEGKSPAPPEPPREGLRTIIYPPAPPVASERHFLGTNSSGYDVLAVLFGGLQQAIVAVICYLSFALLIGVTIGAAMGYLGGPVDLFGQRLIEIWSSLPFLYVVMIISAAISPTLIILVGVIALFSWMGPTTYMRTAAYREKARDYVAAARLLGAGSPRIIFHHILPNAISTLVTLAPFLSASIITSLAALDFLGFGLPPEEPSWGRLLHEGTENFNAPWIVAAAFIALSLTLILITLVGEAIREAFDPKKFTTYQ